jgi:hypothetical protein
LIIAVFLHRAGDVIHCIGDTMARALEAEIFGATGESVSGFQQDG